MLLLWEPRLLSHVFLTDVFLRFYRCRANVPYSKLLLLLYLAPAPNRTKTGNARSEERRSEPRNTLT